MDAMTESVKILVIDDSEDDQLFYRRTLQKNSDRNYVIVEAGDGEQGLTCVETEKPACVLLDYSLPGSNGIEILKRVRSQHPFMPVVMLTGQGNEAVAVTAMQEGAQNYISKSAITPETLTHVISMAIEHCAMQKRLHEQRTSLEVFTRALAHDLKEPIRTICSFTDLISRSETFSEKARAYFEHIQNASDRMRMLIDTVFFYTRLEMPEQAEREVCDTGVVLKEVQDNLAQLIQERGAAIGSDTLPAVYGNRMQLMQVLQNLIGNAIRHGNPPIVIHIGAEDKQTHWLFRVTDNGPGIPQAYQRKIFEPFQRLSHQDQQGAGLGLAICQRIIESHGGEIWCQSEPGEGATFMFTLPKVLSASLPDEPPVVQEPVMPAAAIPADHSTLANVLLVDDSRADMEIAKYRLIDEAQLQCNLLEARGGEQALTMLRAGAPDKRPIDLVLLDINMPEMNGFDLLELIRKDEALKNTAVVMCTGSIYDKDMARSRALGALGYLTKPIEFPKLEYVINRTTAFHLRKESEHYLLLRAA